MSKKKKVIKPAIPITGKDQLKKKVVEAKKEETVPNQPLSSLTAAERLSNLPTYGSYISSEKVQSMFAHFLFMPIGEIQNLSKKEKLPALSVIEQQILSLISNGMKGKDSLNSIQYMHERAFGKPKQSVELSGPDKGPIKIDTNTVLEAMETLPKEVLALLMKKSEKEKS